MPARVMRLLMRALPADFRRRHGPAMQATFDEGYAAARAREGWMGANAWAVRQIVDLGAVCLRLWWRRWVRGTVDDLRYAVRSLVRRPAGARFAAATLALGLGASTAIFAAVDSTLFRPVPVADADRVIFLWRTIGGQSYLAPAREDFQLWADQTDLFEPLVRYSSGQVAVRGVDGPEQRRGFSVSPEFFAFGNPRILLGRAFDEADAAEGAPPVILLGEALWRSRFASAPGAMGQQLHVEGVARTIVGVLASEADAWVSRGNRGDLWLPLAVDAPRALVVTRLRPGVSFDAAQARLDVLGATMSEGKSSPTRYVGRTAWSMVSPSLRDSLRLLSLAVTLLLAIACMNVATLLLHRGGDRRRETAVRIAVGASRTRVIRQFLLESLLIGVSGCLGGLALAYGSLRLVQGFAPDSLPWLARLSLDPRAVLFAALAGLGTSVLFGLAPALQAAFPGRRGVLAGVEDGRASRAGRRVRSWMIVAEVALSFALLVGAGGVLTSLVRMQGTNPGFVAAGLTALRVDLPRWKYEGVADREQVLARMRNELARLPNRGVARSTGVPPESGIYFGVFEIEGRAPDPETGFFWGNGVDEQYFGVLGQTLVAGRGPTSEDVLSDAPVWVIGESTARRFFPDGGAVGARARFDQDDWHTIIGVASDAVHTGLAGEKSALQLYSLGPPAMNVLLFREASAGTGDLRAVLRGVEADALVEVMPLPDLLRASLTRERLVLLLLACFAGLAVVLSGVGLYGVISRLVAQQNREFGIRMALGARRAEIARSVLESGGVATAYGVALGIAISFVGLRVAGSALPGLESSHWYTYAAAAALMVTVALAASWIPARRATRTDPARVLRAD